MTSAGKDAHVLLGGFALGLKPKLALLGLLTLVVAIGYSGMAHAQSPVAAYSFDEGSGETAKDSAGDHDGTIEGASWVSSGKYGSALEFDGENDRVSIADAADLDLTGSFTLEAWVQPDAFGAARPVISKVGFPETGVGGYQLEGTSAGTPLGRVAASGAVKGVEGAEALSTEETWSHVTLTSDESTLRLYVNGDLVKSDEGLAAADTGAALKIGNGFGGWFNGRIDEVRVYDEALSEGQIQSDQNSPLEPPLLQEYTTGLIDSGASSELVSGVPITESGTDTTVYSLSAPSLMTGELLRVAANLEVTNTHAYTVASSVRVVLGENSSDSSGTEVIPWTTVTQTPAMYHWTFPINGSYRVPADLGTQYLKVVVKASSSEAQEEDTLTVQPNFGRLTAVRSTPAAGPMSQPTHALESHAAPVVPVITDLPVDSSWRTVLTREVSNLVLNDIIDIASQIGIQKTSEGTVRLEAQLIRSTQPLSTGATKSLSSPATDILVDGIEAARVTLSNAIKVDDAAKRYINLRLRAVPISGEPDPLTLLSNGAQLDVLRMAPNPEEPAAPLLDGTLESDPQWDATANVSSIPFAVSGGSEKRVVASRDISSLQKGEVLYARGLIVGDLAESTENTQVLTRLIVADSATATTGETLGVFSGDKVPAATQIHTSIKEGIYVAPEATNDKRYLNFVVYASQANPSGSMDVPIASVNYTRTTPRSPLNIGFEHGFGEDGVDSVLEYEFDGTLSASSAYAREGDSSLLVDLDHSLSNPDDSPGSRRVEARPPDLRASGGVAGGETWYGFSAYFPEEFNVPGVNPYRLFDGVIDEVRIYDEALSESQITDDLAGEYGENPTPVANYTFDTGAGSVAEDSAGEHDGTIVGATWTSGGRIGAALDFDGLNDLVVVPDHPGLDLTEDFTLEAWVKPDLLASLSPAISKGEGPDERAGYALAAQSFGGPTAEVLDSSIVRATASSQLPKETWSHIAMSNSGGTLRLYVNGELAATAESVNAGESEADLTIGASSDLVEEDEGPYTVFTQWRHPGLGGISGCPSTPGAAPPVVLTARYYTAGAHTNPGESETATPTAGDYIDARFYGGELTSNCQGPANPEQRYVVAPLERNKWYDFVQHTRWTAEEGEAGNSVSELWINGKQVLGNKSVPVTTPSLFWHETPTNHNITTYPQFGLYGGYAFEDPTQRIYIDAVRSGNSYAEVSPGE